MYENATHCAPRERQKSEKKDRIDLVLAFGDATPDIWVIEAKIKSAEGFDQLQRYESKEAQQEIADKFGVERPPQHRWHYSYLTLEGNEPAQPGRFKPVEYEKLCRIFTLSTPELDEGTLPAYQCLRNRLNDYYRVRDEVLNSDAPFEDTTLENYLSDTRGLISKTNRFHWLTKRIARELGGLQFECGVAQNIAFANPMCRTVSPHWRGQRYGEGEVSLRECFDIHLELQLSMQTGNSGSVAFILHYETNPYMRGLNAKTETEVPEKQRKEYWERRREFARALGQNRKELEGTRWQLDHIPPSWGESPLRSSNQLAKFENFTLNRRVVNFRNWVRDGTKAITKVVEHTGAEVGLWK